VKNSRDEKFSVRGFCVPCGTRVKFLVDMEAGGQRTEDGWVPNWRERVVCPTCGMNNRQRLIATLVKRELDRDRGINAWFMEYVTPIYKWVERTYKGRDITGSEYLGHQNKSGDVIDGIRHEDVTDLSFEDECLDLIVSNDVFEHVPRPAEAFKECARVLRPGGMMLATIPFYNTYDLSVVRARLTGHEIENLLPPMFHGNPVSDSGSLVFTDFGWDIVGSFLNTGFSDALMEGYASVSHGHYGTGQLVFRLIRA
jgi:SAM-dependent methyltransferase